MSSQLLLFTALGLGCGMYITCKYTKKNIGKFIFYSYTGYGGKGAHKTSEIYNTFNYLPVFYFEMNTCPEFFVRVIRKIFQSPL